MFHYFNTTQDLKEKNIHCISHTNIVTYTDNDFFLAYGSKL